ncbi:MAG: hypothetical protein CMK09_04800 [Ponticaulis sp.]|nr:hypothetical protein [Ponticaulis sp.]
MVSGSPQQTEKSGRGLQNWQSKISLIFGADFPDFRKQRPVQMLKNRDNAGILRTQKGYCDCQEILLR